MERKFGNLKKLCLALLLGLGTATAAVAAGVSDREILIGTHLDLSGPVAAGMPQLRNGMQMRLDEAVRQALNWMLGNFSSIKKVGIIYQEGPYGDLVTKGVKEALTPKGLSIAAEAGYKAGDIDFSSQVARMKAAGVDLIVAATITRETISVMAETKKLGWNDVKVLTSNPGRTGVVLALGKDSVEGLYGVGTWKIFAPTDLPADLRRWADAYKKRFNIDPDENAMLSYSYTDMFVKGLQAAGRDLTTDKAVKALQGVTSTGLVFYGPEGFKNNHMDPDFVEVDQVKGGKWVTVSPTLK
jgi:branched-chain amino acid transport system substrate-binding protein